MMAKELAVSIQQSASTLLAVGQGGFSLRAEKNFAGLSADC
jgi:hypothetical protein